MATTELDTQHQDAVHDTQFDYYGRFMATASSDKSVRVFAAGEGNSGQLLAVITGHDAPVWMIDWAHPSFGVALATCSYDGKAIVWKGSEDGASWKPSTMITAHSASVNAVSFAPAAFGLAVATASSDGNVMVTQCPDGTWREPYPLSKPDPAHPLGAFGVSWAPMPAADAPAMLASGGADGAVKVWLREEGGWSMSKQFKDHKDWVRDVAFSPDVSSHVVLASCSQDKTVILRRAARDDLTAWETSSAATFNDTVWRLSWNPSGSALLVTTGDGQAFVLKQGVNFGDEWVRTPVNAEDAPQ